MTLLHIQNKSEAAALLGALVAHKRFYEECIACAERDGRDMAAKAMQDRLDTITKLLNRVKNKG